MLADVSIGFRLPGELVLRIDAYAAQIAEQAGVPVSRSAAIRRLLEQALKAEGKRKPR